MHSVIPAGGGGILSITDLSPTKSTKLPNEASVRRDEQDVAVCWWRVSQTKTKHNTNVPRYGSELMRRALIELVRWREIAIKD